MGPLDSPEPSPAPGLPKPSWHQRAWASADWPPGLLAILASWHSRRWPSALATGPKSGLGPRDRGEPQPLHSSIPHPPAALPATLGWVDVRVLLKPKSQDLCTSIDSGWSPPLGDTPPHTCWQQEGLTGLVLTNTDGANTLNSVVFVSICLCSDECIYFSDWGQARGRPGSAMACSHQTEPPQGLIQDCKKRQKKKR